MSDTDSARVVLITGGSRGIGLACAHRFRALGDHVAVRSGVAVDPDLTLTGNAVHLLEALSVRAPLEQTVPSESSWMINGLAEIFEAGR